MLHYREHLKHKARELRGNPTDSERVLWSRIRSKQLMEVQFYRQRPIGNYIVDFFAPIPKLVIEVDGSQHRQEDNLQRDKFRYAYLADLGFKVLRFNSREVLTETDAVIKVIQRSIVKQLGIEGLPRVLL